MQMAPLVSFANSQPTALSTKTNEDIQALLDQALYWYDRYRFDLSDQRLNRILLLSPNDPNTLKWKGLIDLRKGNVGAANVWLKALETNAGKDNPQTIELKQSVLLATELRQRFATLQFLSRKTAEQGKEWVKDLLGLFDQEPMGEAAIGFYDALANDPASKPYVVSKVRSLIRRFPQDKRYRKLLADLGQTLTPEPETLARVSGPTIRKPRVTTPKPEPVQAEPEAPREPELSDFAKGEILNKDGIALAERGMLAQAGEKLLAAVELNPLYPWFRFDLANFYESMGTPESSAKARQLMAEGRRLVPDSTEMVFASALLTSTQNNPSSAIKLLKSVPNEQWTSGMSALERRSSYALYIAKLNAIEASGQRSLLAKTIESNPRWLAEPAVQEMVVDLKERRTATFSTSYRRGSIAGTEGVSGIEDTIVPMEWEIPYQFDGKIFLRTDYYRVDAGNYSSLAVPSDANQFGYLGVRIDDQIDNGATSPASGNLSANYFDNANQRYDGYLLAIGYRGENWRADIGKPVGNYPVNSWLGGVEIDKDIGETGLLRVTLARRMIDGSVLSAAGTRDPETGQTWGGVRRNGLTALYYTPWGEKSDFVGIARYNLITGENIPNNKEINLQGIVSTSVWSNTNQNVDIGASLFLWKFDKNMRFYTFGQGGYYSPQRFASLSIPVTWTGSTPRWSWRAQISGGKSRSNEGETSLYPYASPSQINDLLANGRALTDPGGDGGGTSYSAQLQIEHLLTDRVVFGLNMQIDRSEDFNPDLFSAYLRIGLNGKIKLSTVPRGLAPYSEF